MSATTSPAIARFEYGPWSAAVGGFDDCPYPRRSGQTTVCPAATSSGATRCQVVWVRGWPCSSTTGGPLPPERTRRTTSPPTSIRCSSNPAKKVTRGSCPSSGAGTVDQPAQHDDAAGVVDVGLVTNALQRPLQLLHVRGEHVHQCVGLAGDGHRAHHLGHPLQ